jgi:hypothetical protein
MGPLLTRLGTTASEGRTAGVSLHVPLLSVSRNPDARAVPWRLVPKAEHDPGHEQDTANTADSNEGSKDPGALVAVQLPPEYVSMRGEVPSPVLVWAA